MTDTTQAPAPAPPKAKRKPARKRAAAAPKPTSELAGLTVALCPTACNEAGCVISGRPYCAHPRKGGLHGNDMGRQDAVRRLNEAKKIIGKRAVDLRFT